MLKLKLLWTFIVMSISCALIGQEICNNGIDDDNDSLIDLNDDECICTDTIPLSSVSGFICRNSLVLTIDNPAATSFQWYKDGVAITDETSDNINIRERDATTNLPLDAEGVYTCLLTGPFGCFITEPYDLVIPTHTTHLGDRRICKGDTVFWGPFAIVDPGYVQFDVNASDGCDSIVSFVVVVVEPAVTQIGRIRCEGSTYLFGDQELTESGFYSHTFQTDEGCDSIVRLNMRFEPLEPIMVSETICKGDTYIFKDIVETESGEYSTTINSPDGCDTTYVVTLSVNEIEPTPESRVICAGGDVEYENEVYDEPGEYVVTLSGAGGCDSLINLSITEEQLETHIMAESICKGKVFDNGYITADEAGTYEYISELGNCDSLIVIELEVFTETITEEVSMCKGDPPFEFEDIKADETGIYTTVVTEPGECDILYEFFLTVLDPSSFSTTRTLCEGEEIIVDGTVITIGGSYDYVIPNKVGCDSTITVEVLESAPQSINISDEICQGDIYFFNGEEITDEGEYTANLESESGCDSIVILDLAFRSEVEVFYEETICEGETYILHDLEVDEQGIYSTMVSMATGCDSLVSLDLKVIPRTFADVTYTMCPGDTYILHDLTTNEAGQFTARTTNVEGCDSIINVELFISTIDTTEIDAEICEGETYFYNGMELFEEGVQETMQVSSLGCDSLVLFNLRVNPLQESIQEVLLCPGEIFSYADIVTSESGVFQTRFSNAEGCDSLVTINVEVEELEGELLLEEEVEVDLGESIDISPDYVSDDFNMFEWIDENGSVISTSEDLIGMSPTEDTYVDLMVTNENGCSLRQRINIFVDDEIKIYIPNIITPDEQGLNNAFTIGADASVIGIQDIVIYDRWGELMYQGYHEGNLSSYLGWDGTFKGKKVVQGVYTYMVIFDIIDGTTRKKAGSVTVI